MNTIRSFASVLWVSGALFAGGAIQNVMASEHELTCQKHIDQKIAWDDNAHTKWEAANLEKLCQGTQNPHEPGECFNQVMHGHVKWGSDDKWVWQNAIRLCSGTNSAADTISCFEKRVEQGVKWEEAILQCQMSGKIKTP